MAFEQNPYAVKVSLVGDTTLNSTITNGTVSASSQFKFVKVAGLAASAFTGTSTAGSSSITAVTVANAAGLVPGAPVSGTNIPAGAFITGITYSGTSIVTIALSNQSATTGTATGNVTPSSQPYGNGPVATSVTAATDRAFGILQNQPIVKMNSSAQIEGVSEAEITVSGISKVVAGAAIPAGAAISCDSSGRAITATFAVSTTYSVTNVFVFGTALTPASAAGDVITVAISCASAGRAA